MITPLEQAAFLPDTLDSLFPFAFVTEADGSVVWAGRSIRKIVGGGEVCGFWHQCFQVERPGPEVWKPENLDTLIGELVVLRVRDDSGPALRFRGQVARIAGERARYAFLLGPSISDIREITQAGLNYTDFAVGDLIFDFLMLLQSERRSFRQSEEARKSLILKNRVSDLLYRCSILSADAKDGGLYPIVALVSGELGFDFGHVFLRHDHSLVSCGEAYCSDSFRQTPGVHGFLPASLKSVFARGQGIPGRVWEKGELIWGERLEKSPQFPRASSIDDTVAWSGIAVPIRVGGELAAVLEFYSLRSMDDLLGDKRTLVQFLETLSLQLSGVIERQRFAERERSQQAMMLASSNLSSLGEMAAGVAHEINNPLTAILLGSTQARQLASKSEPDLAALGRILERIERSAERIGKIVSGMRTLSRDGSGDPFVPVQVTAILEDTLSICSTRFRNAGIELCAPDDGVSGLAVQCRPVQVSQVLLNLLNNAFDAVGGQQGPWVRVEVAASADSDGGQWVEMAVMNSGPKISRDLAQQVMRPFFTTKPVGKGTGLGLSIARSIAEVHGGSLSLDLSGEHTRFVLKLKRDLSTS